MPKDNLASRITLRQNAGLVVGPDDMADFLEAADTLHGSLELRTELARNARSYAEATFPIERTATVFEEILSPAS